MISLDQPVPVCDLKALAADAVRPSARRLHRRNAALFAFLLVGAIVGGWAAHDVQIYRLANRLLDEAQEARERQSFRESAQRLAEYMQLHPDDDEAKIRLALDHAEAIRDPWELYRTCLEVEQLLSRFPERKDLRRKAAELMLEGTRVADALIHLDVLLESEPDDPELQLLLGRCYESQGATEVAIGIFRSLIATAPQSIPAYERLAELLARSRETQDEATEVLDAMLAANPDQPQAYLAHARYLRNRGELASAWTDALKSFALAPEEVDTLCLLGALAGKAADGGLGLVDEGGQIGAAIRRAIERKPKQARLYVALAQLRLGAGRVEEARKSLEEGLSRAGRRTELAFCLADLLLAEGDFGEATRLVERLRSEKVDPILTGFIESRLAMLQGDWAKAFRLLSHLHELPGPRQDDLSLQIEMHLARCCERLRHTAWRLAACRRAVQLSPRSIEARFELADATEEEGLLEESANIYRSLQGDPRAEFRLARVLLRQNLRRPVEERRWDEFAAMLEARPERRESPEWVLLESDGLAGQDELSRAADVLAEGCERFPQRVDLQGARAQVLARLGQTERAGKIVDAAVADLGLDRNLVMLKVLLWSEPGDGAAGSSLERVVEELLERIRSQPVEQRFALLEACAQTCRQRGALQLAAGIWDELAALAPDDVAVRKQQLDLDLQRGDEAGIEARIADLRRIEGERGVYWRLGNVLHSMRLARRGQPTDLKQARALLREVATQFPDALTIPLVEAEVAEVLGDLNSAVEHYRDALEAGTRSPEVLFNTTRLLAQLQRFAEVEQILERFPPDVTDPGSLVLTRLSAEAALRSGNFDVAIARAKSAVRGEGEFFDDFIWLGTLLEAAGRHEQAETALRKAHELAPEEPAACLALVAWLARRDRSDEGEAVLDAFAARNSGPLANVTAARGSAILGHSGEAQARYAAALAQAPDDPLVAFSAAEYYMQTDNLAAAEPLWRKVCQSQDKECERVLPAARRGLASCLADRGAGPDLADALELLRQNTEAVGESAADLRIKARVLALDPRRQMRKQAVSILTRLGENATFSPDDQFLLAKLHISLGDWAAARGELQNLVSLRPRDPEPLAFGIAQMLARDADDLEMAGNWLQRLSALEPASFRTLALAVRLMVAEDRCDEARRVLHSAVAGAAAAAPGGRLDWWREAGLLSDALAQELVRQKRGEDAAPFYEDAEEYLRTCVARAPARVPELVQFLARRGRLDEALDLAEHKLADCLPAELAIALVNALQSGKPAPQEFQRARALLEDGLLKSEPSNVQVLFSLGNLAQVWGRYSDAERFFRRTLELDPDHVLAANNLAYLAGVREGDLSEAVRVINRALELAGPIPALLDTRAIVSKAAGHPEDAIADLEAALVEQSAPAYEFHLCQALLASRRRGAARSNYQKLLAAGIGKAQLPPVEGKAWDALEREMKLE